MVLLGLMGAGKTTVGRALAVRLGWPVRDSDADIRARTGRTSREIDQDSGTAALHRLEAEQLLGALAAPGPSVICAAASTIDEADCRAALGDPGLFVVWLRGEPATLARRAAPRGHRRDLGPDRAAALAEQAAVRGPRFGAVATLTLDEAGRTPAATAEVILARLPRA